MTQRKWDSGDWILGGTNGIMGVSNITHCSFLPVASRKERRRTGLASLAYLERHIMIGIIIASHGRIVSSHQ